MRLASPSAKIAIAGLALALLAGCTAIMPAETRARITRVGVVSLLGDEVHYYQYGIYALFDGSKRYPVPGWNLDDTATKIVVRSLSELDPQLSVVAVPYDRPALMRGYRIAAAPGFLFDLDRVIPRLRLDLAESPVDAVVLLTRDLVRDPIYDPGLHYDGIGVHVRPMLFGVWVYGHAFAFVNLQVLDGRTLATLGAASRAAYRDNTPGPWSPNFADPPPTSELMQLKQEIEALLAETLPALLREAGF